MEFSGIGDRNADCDPVLFHLKACDFSQKFRIGESKAERKTDLFLRCCLKIAIANIDVLFIQILLTIAEIFIGRVIGDSVSDGICQLSAGVHFSRQHIHSSETADHTALPCV